MYVSFRKKKQDYTLFSFFLTKQLNGYYGEKKLLPFNLLFGTFVVFSSIDKPFVTI